ncbi:3567_t:CDS:2, partial [Paraglomus brasilianum]
GGPHARIVCEIALAQSTNVWNLKCENWMSEQYVRCVFGIKIHSVRHLGRQVHRSMTARLWTRVRPPPPAVSVAVPGLLGVFSQTWDFGTLEYNSDQATACTAVNNPLYQVSTPVADVFWNPPLTAAGVPNEVGYIVAVPGTLTANNFVIDLYNIQQLIMKWT